MKSTPTAALGAFLGIGPLQNIISLQVAKEHYWIKEGHGAKLLKGSKPRGSRSEGALGRLWDTTPQALLFDKK